MPDTEPSQYPGMGDRVGGVNPPWEDQGNQESEAVITFQWFTHFPLLVNYYPEYHSVTLYEDPQNAGNFIGSANLKSIVYTDGELDRILGNYSSINSEYPWPAAPNGNNDLRPTYQIFFMARKLDGDPTVDYVSAASNWPEQAIGDEPIFPTDNSLWIGAQGGAGDLHFHGGGVTADTAGLIIIESQILIAYAP